MTPQYAAFIAPAKPSNQIWRLVLGLASIVGVYFAVLLIIGAGLWALLGGETLHGELQAFQQTASPWAVIVTLASFIGGWIGVALTLRLLHGRSLGSQLGRAPVVLRDFVLGVVILTVVAGGLSYALFPGFRAAELAIDPAVWLWFLPLALIGLLIQTGAEELVFRGYFQTQLAARFRWAPIYLILPSICFALAHMNPNASQTELLLILAVTGAFGLMAADLTAQTGSLGLAWGLHFANNIFALLIINATGDLSALNGLALLEVPEAMQSPASTQRMLMIDIAITASVWVVCRLWLRRR